jgi:hypothetical protein
VPIPRAIQVGDFVVATKTVGPNAEHSVGLVRNVSGDDVTVLFIGTNTTLKTDSNHVAYLDVRQTGKPLRIGKPYEMKICNICHVLKDMSEFDINQSDASGRKTRRPSCRDCRVKIDGRGMKETESRRLDAMKPKGVFTCPICGKRTIVGVTVLPRKDHDHNTGMGREWICDSCNTGLGRFQDSPDLLRKAIEYLRKYGVT